MQATSRTDRLNSNANLNTKTINLAQKILSKNDKKANELRKIYKDLGLYVINIMSSPGSGKTTLLENLREIKNFRFCVLEGDLQTNRDADRLLAKGIGAVQITTGEACHLEAAMIESALQDLQKICDMKQVDYLIIENVGNLVCPASYDLGADLNIVLLSTPEGDDKVLKYPSMFLCADLVVISKFDIVEHFSFDINRIKADLDSLKNVPLMSISKNDKQSLQNLVDFFAKQRSCGYSSKHNF